MKNVYLLWHSEIRIRRRRSRRKENSFSRRKCFSFLNEIEEYEK
jgi:hypothetical protein